MCNATGMFIKEVSYLRIQDMDLYYLERTPGHALHNMRILKN